MITAGNSQCLVTESSCLSLKIQQLAWVGPFGPLEWENVRVHASFRGYTVRYHVTTVVNPKCNSPCFNNCWATHRASSVLSGRLLWSTIKATHSGKSPRV